MWTAFLHCTGNHLKQEKREAYQLETYIPLEFLQ